MDEAHVIYAGLDLAGPAHPEATVLGWFRPLGDALAYEGHICPASDGAILSQLKALTVQDEVILGVDAPLSYHDGGGMRPCDKLLERELRRSGLEFIGVMSPTFRGMAWLTLRGMGLARSIELLPEAHRIRIVEVHPGAALGLRGAPVQVLKRFKKDDGEAMAELRQWLAQGDFRRLPDGFPETDHEVDSAACALAAWEWHEGKSAWLAAAQPPQRPYDFAC